MCIKRVSLEKSGSVLNQVALYEDMDHCWEQLLGVSNTSRVLFEET